jgi:hypothetical protein
MQVVVDPEEQLLGLRRPGDRELLVPEELAEDFFLEGHRVFLLCSCLASPAGDVSLAHCRHVGDPRETPHAVGDRHLRREPFRARRAEEASQPGGATGRARSVVSLGEKAAVGLCDEAPEFRARGARGPEGHDAGQGRDLLRFRSRGCRSLAAIGGRSTDEGADLR